jgi:hypothetical protein
MEVSEGLSKGRRTKSCENHLQNYIRGGWITVNNAKELST